MLDSPTSRGRARTQETRVSRRMFLGSVSALVPVLSLNIALPGTAFAATDGDFMSVSKVIAGDHPLKADFAQALLAAFRKQDAAFDDKLAKLRALIGDAPLDSDTLKARLADADKDVAALPQAILTGWYLGVAGSGDDATCVAYADALAYVEVSDVLRPPSYAYGAYGSWAAKPA